MPRILQIIVTDNFAGAERYVSTLSRSLASLGHEVTVVGGAEAPMRAECGPGVTWRPGRTPLEAVLSVSRAGQFDVCHVHMTYAEAVALLLRPVHGAPVVATRHFARRRGSNFLGRLASRVIRRGLRAEIAISRFVADAMEAPPTDVIINGVDPVDMLWKRESRNVLVLQRLEAEKQTHVALDAWAESRLSEKGWTLRIVGDGSQLGRLSSQAEDSGLQSVEFVGWASDVQAELSQAGILLATAPEEPLGLSVLEAMAAGVPVVAAAGGGHLETVGLIPAVHMFRPEDAKHAATSLRLVAEDTDLRSRLSSAGRSLHGARFHLKRHVEAVEAVYRRTHRE